MAKGPEKNTRDKALHTKLLNLKKAKNLRLKVLVTKVNQ